MSDFLKKDPVEVVDRCLDYARETGAPSNLDCNLCVPPTQWSASLSDPHAKALMVDHLLDAHGDRFKG